MKSISPLVPKTVMLEIPFSHEVEIMLQTLGDESLPKGPPTQPKESLQGRPSLPSSETNVTQVSLLSRSHHPGSIGYARRSDSTSLHYNELDHLHCKLSEKLAQATFFFRREVFCSRAFASQACLCAPRLPHFLWIAQIEVRMNS